MKRTSFLWLLVLLLGTTLGGCGSDSPSPDLTPPTLAQNQPSNPADGATNVPLNTVITLSFNETIDSASVTAGTFTLSSNGTNVPGAVSVSGPTVTFQSVADLGPDTTYVVTLAPGVTDMAGNAMTTGYSWNFMTSAAPDLTAPSVSPPPAPADGAVDVPINTSITLTFSEPIASTSVTSSTFVLSAGGTAVPGTLAVQDGTITFQPQAALGYDTLYTVTAQAGITDLADNPLGAAYSWSFTTAAAPDTTPPTVSTVTPPSPADGAVDVPVSTAVSITFSEAMAAASFTSADFLLSTGVSNVAGVISVSGATATFQPSADLTAGTTYTATVKGSVTDLAGNPLGSDHTWGFTTAAATIGPALDAPLMLNTAGVTTYSYTYEGGLVQIDDQGNAIAVWIQADPYIHELWTSRYQAPTATTAGAWSSPQMLASPATGETIYEPALAMNGAGEAILVWRVYVSAASQSYLYSRYFDPVSGWGAVEPLNSAAGGGLMRVVLDDSGNATVAWERSKPVPGRPSSGRVKTVGANRYDPASGWGPEVLLEDLVFTDAADFSDVKVPTLALDSAGHVTAVWKMYDTTNYNVHAARFNGVSWSSVATLHTTSNYIVPFMAAGADGSGNVTVAWRQNGTGSNTLGVAQFDATGSSWGTPLQLADAAGLTASDLAVDASGTAMVIWRQEPATNQEIMSRLYTPGSGWASAVSVTGADLQTAPSSESVTRIAASGSGNFFAGWNAGGSVSPSATFANLYDPLTGWGTLTVIHDQNGSAAGLPKLSANPSGEAVMTWGQSSDKGTWGSLYH
ncbi:Ig-like domain-containing protein [Geopsychrobacter electrodiphilus]|uniref:Ig-like domain-containing protein n=1 Tax=Geopsychrobacter electrodiphilus TaxID=225196 RepID=UPI00037300E2|nr:Ig-like domain-containing protein [Geopsychrobacter electrodiphilus]